MPRPTEQRSGWPVPIPTCRSSRSNETAVSARPPTRASPPPEAGSSRYSTTTPRSTAGWIEAGLDPFADPTVGSVAPLVLVRSEPGRVDSAGDSYALTGWPTKRGHGQPGELFAGAIVRRGLRRQRIERLLPRRPFTGSVASIPLRIVLRRYRPGIPIEMGRLSLPIRPGCVIHHDVSATYDHGSPALQRRMARNAEIVFWANMPVGLLMLALLPHLTFLTLQFAWRLAAASSRSCWASSTRSRWREIRSRRKSRFELARKAVAAPHFAVDEDRCKMCATICTGPLSRLD